MKAREMMMKAFRSGEIYLKYTSGDKTKWIYPKMQNVDIDSKRLQIVFTIPVGMNPSDVKKKEWVFKQVFGKNIELEDDNKVFVFRLYANSLPKEAKYSYESILPHIEGFDVPIVAGVDRNGKVITWDMADGKPHLLVAGENGSGKSVQVRQILSTLIQYKDPSELHLYLCDPKFTEFHLFEDVGHVQGKIAFEMHDIYMTIADVKGKLDERKKLIGEQHKLTGIKQYNQRYPDKKLPYIILGIDEFAQLKKEKDAIELIEIISAQGRAFGIFLLLATQRPDREVMNGLIKQNITIRMGFRHADLINSRITNTIGAEKIKIEEKGRFILKMDEEQEIQAPYLTETNAETILKRYKSPEKKERSQGRADVNKRKQSTKEETDLHYNDIFGVLDDEETR